MRARPSIDAPADKAQKRPFLGRFDASRTETRENVFDPQKREKKAPAKTHAQGLDIPPIPLGESWGLGGIGGIARLIARMKNIRSHRSGRRVEFSFGITSHKNYYVNSRVQNEETSAFETN